MVAASQDLSAKLTALAVVEGTCVDVSPNVSPSLSKAGVAGVPGSAEGVARGSGGGGNGCEAVEQQPQPQRYQDTAGVKRKDSEGKVVVGEPRGGGTSGRRCSSASAASMNSSSTSSSGGRGRMPAPPLRVKPPARGFHLVDLHAVVRNSVEWRQCLPKVG